MDYEFRYKDLIVTPAGEEDIEASAALYAKVCRYLQTHINYPDWEEDVYPSIENSRKGVADGTLYLCRDEEGNLLGQTILSDDPAAPYEADFWTLDLPRGEYMVIHQLCADPDAKGRGVGHALVKCCLDRAKQLGYASVRMDVVPGNLPAEALYKSEGFRVAGTKDLEYYDDEEFPVDLYEYDF